MTNPMELPEEYHKLAQDIFDYMGQQCVGLGLEPNDPVIGRLAATLLVGYYAVNGHDPELKVEILKMVRSYLDAADSAQAPPYFRN